MKKYLPRIADSTLDLKLKSSGAVLITGPKWCGKSTLAEQFAKSVVYLQDKEHQDQNIKLATISPSIFLKGATPKLIDEWQLVPSLWDSVRFEIDHRDEFGQFILTGSTTPVNSDEISHSGVGRISKLTLRPMSLFESLDSTGEVSIKSIVDGNLDISGSSDKTILDYAYLCCRGGWPKTVNQEKDVALALAKNYYEGLVSDDIRDVDNVKRDKFKVEALLRSYARNIATSASTDTLLEDIKTYDNSSMSINTLSDYIQALKKLFVLEDSPAWNPNLRSKTAIRTSPTRYFVDPSIATSALGVGPEDLINDLNTFGLIFECMCIRDLRVYAEKLDATIYHYRDKTGLESDAVIHFRNGKWGLIEVKLGDAKKIDESAENLKKLANNIDTTKMKSPSFLMVLTGTPYAYKREDGVLVCPLGCLKD